MKYRRSLFLVSLLTLSLLGCQEQQQSSQVQEDEYVPVYVLAGQSNMEGSTFFDNGQNWLRNAMTDMDLDPEPCFDGIPNVLTSYYGYYPYQGGDWSTLTPHASNLENPMAGEFLETKVGMGNTDNYMGPEIGLAYTLQDYADESLPIFFIKCAFSGSGFDKDPSWRSEQQGVTNELYSRLEQYTHNNLQLIEDMGYTPRIKALLWHQGESDCGNNAYVEDLEYLVGNFREEFGTYAEDEDGEQIAFIDALIYDAPQALANFSYGAGVNTLNAQKNEFASNGDLNFCIDTSFSSGVGLELEIGGGRDGGNYGGCSGTYHYTTRDCFRLGEAYANMILDNDLI